MSPQNTPYWISLTNCRWNTAARRGITWSYTPWARRRMPQLTVMGGDRGAGDGNAWLTGKSGSALSSNVLVLPWGCQRLAPATEGTVWLPSCWSGEARVSGQCSLVIVVSSGGCHRGLEAETPSGRWGWLVVVMYRITYTVRSCIVSFSQSCSVADILYESRGLNGRRVVPNTCATIQENTK